ncbi:MAG: hypothetical protein WBS22_02000 [Methylocystis sp.]
MHFLIAERFAVSRSRVLLVRRAVTDVAVEYDEGRAFFGLMKNVEGALDPVDVIGVPDAQDVPAIANARSHSQECQWVAERAKFEDIHHLNRENRLPIHAHENSSSTFSNKMAKADANENFRQDVP